MIVYSDGTWVTGDADGITPDTATYIPDNSVFAAEVLKYRRVTVEKDQNGEVTSPAVCRFQPIIFFLISA